MQLNLKLGGNPWLLSAQENIPYVVGIHSYLSPYSEKSAIFAIAQNSRGELLKQFDPIEPEDFEELSTVLTQFNKHKHRVLYIFSAS